MLVCSVPRDSAEFSRVFSIEQKLFGELALPRSVAERIFKLCPEIWAAVFGPDDTVVAYSTAYPLKRKWADAFIAGDITEPDLTPEMMSEQQGMLESSCIYIGSVVVNGEYNVLMKATLLASLFSWRVQQMQTTSAKRLSVIMTPVTEEGRRMAQTVGAKELNCGANRKDGHPVYGREITPGFLYQATAAMERCLNSGVVKMNFNFRRPESLIRRAACSPPWRCSPPSGSRAHNSTASVRSPR
jgi:hypothetical protein